MREIITSFFTIEVEFKQISQMIIRGWPLGQQRGFVFPYSGSLTCFMQGVGWGLCLVHCILSLFFGVVGNGYLALII